MKTSRTENLDALDWAETDSGAELLARANMERLVDERRSIYGHPLLNHQRIADFWTVRLRDKLREGAVIEPHEAAACMRLVKEARLMQTRGHADSLDDIEGYADVEREIHSAQPPQMGDLAAQ